MKPRHFFTALVVALVILGAYNVAILHFASSSQRQRARQALQCLPATAQTFFLGNSLVEAGCDLPAFMNAAAHRGAPQPAVNLALGATTPAEHALILREALKGAARPKYLIYGFFDDQLILTPSGDWSLLVGNRAISYYYADAAAELYAPGSVVKRWELRLTNEVPMLAERSSLWTQVELLRRLMGRVGMPDEATNRFGRVADFNDQNLDSIAAFNRRCNEAVRRRSGFSPPVQEILQSARTVGMQVVFVEMPLSSAHRSTFYASAAWAQMRSHLQQLATEAGAKYLNASDWVRDDNNFIDDEHLNQNGAKIFSTRLAGAMETMESPQVAVGSGAPR